MSLCNTWMQVFKEDLCVKKWKMPLNNTMRKWNIQLGQDVQEEKGMFVTKKGHFLENINCWSGVGYHKERSGMTLSTCCLLTHHVNVTHPLALIGQKSECVSVKVQRGHKDPHESRNEVAQVGHLIFALSSCVERWHEVRVMCRRGLQKITTAVGVMKTTRRPKQRSKSQNTHTLRELLS